MSALADSSKRWHIVLRCTNCGPLGLLLLTYFKSFRGQCSSDHFSLFVVSSQTKDSASVQRDWNKEEGLQKLVF